MRIACLLQPDPRNLPFDDEDEFYVLVINIEHKHIDDLAIFGDLDVPVEVMRMRFRLPISELEDQFFEEMLADTYGFCPVPDQVKFHPERLFKVKPQVTRLGGHYRLRLDTGTHRFLSTAFTPKHLRSLFEVSVT